MKFFSPTFAEINKNVKITKNKPSTLKPRKDLSFIPETEKCHPEKEKPGPNWKKVLKKKNQYVLQREDWNMEEYKEGILRSLTAFEDSGVKYKGTPEGRLGIIYTSFGDPSSIKKTLRARRAEYVYHLHCVWCSSMLGKRKSIYWE